MTPASLAVIMFGDDSQRVGEGAWKAAAAGHSAKGAEFSGCTLNLPRAISLTTTTTMTKIMTLVITFIKSPYRSILKRRTVCCGTF